MTKPLPPKRRSRPPYFLPVHTRARRDGWSPKVQCAFLAQLYLTGSVAMAARRVGRSRATAYALRGKDGAESFAEAWDHILAGPSPPGIPPVRKRRVTDWRKLTLADLEWRVEAGLWRPLIFRGRMLAIVRKPDNSALSRLVRRLDARCKNLDESGW